MHSTPNRKEKICCLLKGIETGNADAAAVVNAEKYIQHNPQTKEGGEGLAALFKRLSKTSPRVNIVRVFEDGHFIFAHTEYEFSTSRIGFEVFRFEDDQTVEHWDNIQARKGPNPSGHTMVDGITSVDDLDRTESNRALVQSFVNDVLVKREFDLLENYINSHNYTEHNPRIGDGVAALELELSSTQENGSYVIEYNKAHRLLAEGNFVLSVSEGSFNSIHSSFYDLFRVEKDKLVEHWDTKEAIPSRDKWNNDNGKF